MISPQRGGDREDKELLARSILEIATLTQEVSLSPSISRSEKSSISVHCLLRRQRTSPPTASNIATHSIKSNLFPEIYPLQPRSSQKTPIGDPNGELRVSEVFQKLRSSAEGKEHLKSQMNFAKGPQIRSYISSAKCSVVS